MPKKVTITVFITRLEKLDNPPTILSFDNFNYYTELNCHCNNCNTDYAAVSRTILSTSTYGCPTCYRKMRVEQTKKMTQRAALPQSVKKRKQTFSDTDCCKRGAAKTKKTKLARYGNQSYCNTDQIRKTKLARFGDGSYNNHEKSKQTNLIRYGSEFLAQNTSILEKQLAHRTKVFTFPSGNSYSVQGYEPTAISILLTQGYSENDLCLRNRPTVKYFWSAEDGYGDNKWHRYTPDIVIPSESRIIEVKSNWTFNGNPKIHSMNLAKQAASITAGYKFEFWIL